MKPFIDQIRDEIIVFDGAMGTLLQERGLPVGMAPELWNVMEFDRIRAIHREYIEAGARVITTNTLGANRFKLRDSGEESRVEDINRAGVQAVREAVDDRNVVIAGSIGPTGRFLEPFGDLVFQEAFDSFLEQAGILIASGVDIISLETMVDLAEMKAAVIAIRELSDIPVIAHVTYTEEGRTITGSDTGTVAAVLDALQVTAIGINCGLGPRMSLEVLKDLVVQTALPVVVQPNNGLPRIENERTVYPLTPEEFGMHMARLVEAGASGVGGCCGTTPSHIRSLANVVRNLKKKAITYQPVSRLASRTGVVCIGQGNPFTIMGERINPTGKTVLAKELSAGRTSRLKHEAIRQVESGADILDVNVGVPGIDEIATMKTAVFALQNVVSVPLALDTQNNDAMREGLRMYCGKPLINSISGETEKMKQRLPFARKFGAGFIALCLDDQGVPSTAEDRIRIAEKIIREALDEGIRKEDILVDCLVIAASAGQSQILETLNAVEYMQKTLGMTTILGISNVSFGLPERPLLNRSLLAMALGKGLQCAIMNPLDREMMNTVRAGSVLVDLDKNAKRYVRHFQGVDKKHCGTSPALLTDESRELEMKLHSMVEHGDKDAISPEILKAIDGDGRDPAELLDRILIPAIQEVGERFQKKQIFLPQLLLSAETVREAFHTLKPLLAKNKKDAADTGRILMATVRGDIHDIGKNIVSLILQNHGFDVVDIGKDVSTEKIINALEDTQYDILGLSALMTTTVTQMEHTIRQVRIEFPFLRILVGGAVLNEKYAEEIGADAYGKDAVAAVQYAKKLMGKED